MPLSSPHWFEGLAGMVVTRAEILHDYVQLQGAGGTLSVYNNWQIVPGTAALANLLGARLASAHEEPAAVVFVFDGETSLVVDLSKGAWQGPEALVIDRVGFPSVVWN